MTAHTLRLAYVPLTDAAPLIVAAELGFAAEEGLTLHLLRAPSWAQLRDLLAAGSVDAAHMLMPMAVARAIGLGPALPPVEVLMILSQGGQAIGASRALADRLPSLTDMAQAARVVLAAAGGPLRVGVPFAFSTHALLMQRWLGAGIDIRTVPPPLMAKALADKDIDLFCVGEPWGSVSAQTGAGVLIAPGRAVWATAPEKALVARKGWAEDQPHAAGALMRAIWRAGRWLDLPANRAIAAEILARPDYLGLLVEQTEPALIETLRFELRTAPGRFMTFHDGAASFPWQSIGGLVADWLAMRHGLPVGPAISVAARVFRSDLYRQHLRAAGADLPGASMKVEGVLAHPTAVASERGTMILDPDQFFDGRIFEPPPL
jgi:NitT/TauT family transport system ATP-binding protein